MNNEIFSSIYEKNFPFWQLLSDEDKVFICNNSNQSAYKKGTHIYDGSGDGGIIFLKKGTLRVYMSTEDGKELTLMRVHENELCILSASFITEPISTDIFVDAEEDSECYYISGDAFESINNKYPQARIYALETTVESLSNAMWIMQQILFMSMDKRLAIFLLDEINRTNTDTIMLTHSLIAKYMGSAREVVSRMLKYFETEGIVGLSRRGVKILDKKRLRELTI
ncbi:MAG: Crp/Fnr family transcriptional regulator [Ruminococcus sp.]|nr:Crp/Fnr family transcriptional regulator [Ruminococcus sp.]MBQ2972709.1 Crp/Fnr family transcriptional regulator [Ruminococcus sp.]